MSTNYQPPPVLECPRVARIQPLYFQRIKSLSPGMMVFCCRLPLFISFLYYYMKIICSKTAKLCSSNTRLLWNPLDSANVPAFGSLSHIDTQLLTSWFLLLRKNQNTWGKIRQWESGQTERAHTYFQHTHNQQTPIPRSLRDRIYYAKCSSCYHVSKKIGGFSFAHDVTDFFVLAETTSCLLCDWPWVKSWIAQKITQGQTYASSQPI